MDVERKRSFVFSAAGVVGLIASIAFTVYTESGFALVIPLMFLWGIVVYLPLYILFAIIDGKRDSQKGGGALRRRSDGCIHSYQPIHQTEVSYGYQKSELSSGVRKTTHTIYRCTQCGHIRQK